MKNNTWSVSPRFGEVYFVEFEGDGSTQRGMRPAVVFQNNVGNRHSPNVIVLPMTSKLKKTNQPTHVVIPSAGTGLFVDSMVLCENPVCMPKERLKTYITSLSKEHMARITEANLMASCGIAYLDPTILQSIWDKASYLNSVS